MKNQEFSDNGFEQDREVTSFVDESSLQVAVGFVCGLGDGQRLGFPPQASLPLLTDVLEYLFTIHQISVQTIKNYKSAILFYWKTLTDQDYVIPGGDQILSDIFRGFALDAQKHVVEWDVRLVLSFYKFDRFKDCDQLSDRELTLKTVFLLALATGKRRSELRGLSHDVCWINAINQVQTVDLSPVPDFLSKTHVVTNGSKAFQPVALRSLDSAVEHGNLEKRLCPVRFYFVQARHEEGLI